MDIQKDRNAFESWFESRYGANFMQFVLDLDMYVDKHTQASWEAWQAAKAQADPDGLVVVHIDALARAVQNIRELNNGEYYSEEIEENVCNIEAIIEAQDE